jgi:PleD family two-component response regulator
MFVNNILFSNYCRQAAGCKNIFPNNVSFCAKRRTAMEEIKSTILIIYDDHADIDLLKRIFEKDYHTVEAQTAAQIMDMMQSHPEIALVVLKYSNLKAVAAERKTRSRETSFSAQYLLLWLPTTTMLRADRRADSGAEDVICTPFNSR